MKPEHLETQGTSISRNRATVYPYLLLKYARARHEQKAKKQCVPLKRLSLQARACAITRILVVFMPLAVGVEAGAGDEGHCALTEQRDKSGTISEWKCFALTSKDTSVVAAGWSKWPTHSPVSK